MGSGTWGKTNLNMHNLCCLLHMIERQMYIRDLGMANGAIGTEES